MSIDSSGLPFGKKLLQFGKKLRMKSARRWYRKERDDRRTIKNAVIAETRELVFTLDLVCGVCGGHPRGTDEMHEVIPRSQTRGMAPIMRFNRRICVRLHRDCHHQVTEHLVELAFLDPERGVDGGLVVQRRGATTATLYRRTQTPSHADAGTGVARRRTWTPSGASDDSSNDRHRPHR